MLVFGIILLVAGVGSCVCGIQMNSRLDMQVKTIVNSGTIHLGWILITVGIAGAVIGAVFLFVARRNKKSNDRFTTTALERLYRKKHLDCVRHITFDPKGPGVVRLHMLPPRADTPRRQHIQPPRADTPRRQHIQPPRADTPRRQHIQPPRADTPDAPFLLLLNGAQLLPLNLSWAILLANFMDEMETFSGREIGEEDWQAIAKKTVSVTRRTYPGTKKAQLEHDLHLMLDSLVAVARGEESPVEIAPMSLGEYADKMTAPHRMDLMVSAMTRNGAWHCNQKCLHCYAAGQPVGERAELDTAGWKEILARLRRAGVPQVTFTGGEPTLRRDLTELVEAAQWFVTRLNTNGQLLTPELCRALYEASLDSVQITLYAADAATHNALVGADGFERTVQGIHNAVEAGLIVSVNTPLCDQNTDYAATLRFARSLGVRYATCSGLIPSGAAEGAESRAMALTAEELTEVLRQAAAVAEELEMELDFTSPGWLDEETLRSLGLHLIPSCGACLSNMAVAPDGTVVPCQSWLGGTALGNMLTDEWETIWNGERCRAIREKSAKMEKICQLRQGNQGGDQA